MGNGKIPPAVGEAEKVPLLVRCLLALAQLVSNLVGRKEDIVNTGLRS